jgi:hypothetical protein
MINVNLLRRIGRRSAVLVVMTLAGLDLPSLMDLAENPVLGELCRDFDDLTQTADLDHLRAEMNDLKRPSSPGGAAAPINDCLPRG